MYAQSINDPDKFWGDIADTFYWKKRWNLLTRSNFDCKKGPISIGIIFPGSVVAHSIDVAVI